MKTVTFFTMLIIVSYIKAAPLENPNIAVQKFSSVYLGNGTPNVMEPGDIINYSFIITNTGDVTLTNVEVMDSGAVITGGPLTLVSGATDNSSITAQHIITATDISNGSYTNQATIQGMSPTSVMVSDVSDDPTDPTNSAANCPGAATPCDPTVTLLDFPVPMPYIAVTFGSGSVDLSNGNAGLMDVGDVINYSFLITNTGNVSLTDVMVNLPGSIVSGGPISMNPGVTDISTFTAQHIITAADISNGSYTNQATVQGMSPASVMVSDVSDDPTNPTNSAANCPGAATPCDPTVTLLDFPVPLTSITVTFGDGSVDLSNGNAGLMDVGDVINYSFLITNTGNVSLTDVMVNLPGSIVSGGPISMNPGVTDISTFTAQHIITAADISNGSYTNQATIQGVSPDFVVVTDVSDDPTNPTNSTANCPGAATPCDPTYTSLDYPLAESVFLIKVKTDNPGFTIPEMFRIPTKSSLTYNYNVDCNNDGMDEATVVTGDYFCDYSASGLNTGVGTYTIRIKDNSGTGDGFPSINFNNTFDRLKIVELVQWGTGKWTNMQRAFYGAENMIVTATDIPDFSKVTIMESMFRRALLANPDTSGWDTSMVNNMKSLFNEAEVATPDTSSWDTHLVDDMSFMFRHAFLAHPNVGSWDISQVMDITGMFSAVTLPTAVYDSILVNFNSQSVHTGLVFHGGNSKYCAVVAHDGLDLIQGWTISDGGLDSALNCAPPSEDIFINGFETVVVFKAVQSQFNYDFSEVSINTMDEQPLLIAKGINDLQNPVIKIYLRNDLGQLQIRKDSFSTDGNKVWEIGQWQSIDNKSLTTISW